MHWIMCEVTNPFPGRGDWNIILGICDDSFSKLLQLVRGRHDRQKEEKERKEGRGRKGVRKEGEWVSYWRKGGNIYTIWA
jgi:hypothetical protein